MEEEGRNADHRQGTEERAPETYIKAWSGKSDQAHIETPGLTGDDATSKNASWMPLKITASPEAIKM